MGNIFSNKYFLGAGFAIIAGLSYYGYQSDSTSITDTTTAGVVDTTAGTNTVSNSGTITTTETATETTTTETQE